MNPIAQEGESPGRWQMLALLALTLVLSMTTWFSASAVIPQLRQEWALSTSATAWLTIAVQLGFVFGALVSSFLNLSDIVSAKHVILGGTIGASTANGLLELAGAGDIGIALRFATGFFLAGVYPPALKLMATWFRRGRGVALGILVGAIVLGQAAPHLINGLGGLDWRLVIYMTSALTLIGGLIAEFAVKEGPSPFPTATFDPKQVWRVFANRGVRLASFGYFGHMWELFAMYAWFMLFFSEALVARGTTVGSAAAFATFAVIAVGALGCWVGGILGDRWGRTRTTALMMAISGSCCILIGLLFGSSPWLLLIVGLVWGFTVVADSAQFSAMVTELADQSYVGTALTLQLALGFVLTIVTIWLIPLIADAFGWRWVFAFLAPGPALGVLAMLQLKSLPESARLAGGIG
ncbi:MULTISPECIES: MFS transporter [unclassified Variovorax]|uniref:MFS transporter n=1 Tax=unclassified Variovorax TaxID=663243 RepID=UPI003ECE4BDA